MENSTVTLPSGGIYLSRFQAGILSTLLSAALIAGFSNLWYLNSRSIEVAQHIRQAESMDATLPGALSRREWQLERQLIATQLREINDKLDRWALELEKSQNKSGG